MFRPYSFALLKTLEKYGYNDAYSKFYPKYKAEKGHVKKGEPILENVLSGKLLYLKMIKGEEDATYLRLRSQFDKLSGNTITHNSANTEFKYILTYDIEKVLDNNICFEFCPTSNLQTKSLKSYEDVPLRRFLEKKIPVCINADNMTVSNVSAIDEMKQMMKTFNLSKQEVYDLYKNAIDHAFVDLNTKNRIKNVLDLRFDRYFKEVLNG